jgi:PAS domain S-box-containing protein
VEEQPAIVALRTGEAVQNVEMGVKTVDGKVSWRLVNAQPVYNDAGTLLGAVASLFDITERRKSEEALRQSEERFSKAFHSSPNAIIISRLSDGLIIEVNDGWTRIFGHEPSEVVGHTSLELGAFAHPGDRAKAIALLQEHGMLHDFELQIRTKSGAIRDASMSVERIEVNDMQCLLTVMQDITERKHAEDALRESEQRFHSLADSMPQLIWTALPDGTVDYYNKRYLEYQDIKQVMKAVWEWAPVLHPDDADATVKAWQHSVSTGELYQIEHRVRMAGGLYRWHLSRGVPTYDEQGRIVRWFGTATDIHEQKTAEEKLKIYTERLERSNRELEQFAFMASHDLQEPLRKIQAFGDLLMERAQTLNDQELEYVKRMRSAAGRMREMVNGLLHLSRVNTQGSPFTTVDLLDVTAGALSDQVELIEKTNGVVEVAPLPTVTGDALQLRQLMQNLIGNALKYHRPEMYPRVRIHAQESDSAVKLFVQDNGIGFDQENAERIFQPFQRLVGRSLYEGSGMGLAICRRIVERHAGEIRALSKPGEGTTIVVILPKAPAAELEKDNHE